MTTPPASCRSHVEAIVDGDVAILLIQYQDGRIEAHSIRQPDNPGSSRVEFLLPLAAALVHAFSTGAVSHE
jgi:hypothetical protein